ncbi:sulfite reductase [Ralstonia solanacearum]|nr:sulfite reductase [Ralstonia solanacearum]
MHEQRWGIASWTLVGLYFFALAVYLARRFGVESQTIAAWVQAVGAIAAIAGAYALGERQMRHAVQREEARRAEALAATHEGIRTIADGAKTEILEVAHALRRHSVDVKALRRGFRPEAFAAMAEALGRIPVLEIRNVDLVRSIIGLQQQMLALLPLLRRASEPEFVTVPGAGGSTMEVPRDTRAERLLALARSAYISYVCITYCCPRAGDEQGIHGTLDAALDAAQGK